MLFHPVVENPLFLAHGILVEMRWRAELLLLESQEGISVSAFSLDAFFSDGDFPDRLLPFNSILLPFKLKPDTLNFILASIVRRG